MPAPVSHAQRHLYRGLQGYIPPAVCYSALALAIIPPIFRMLVMGQPAMWGDWLYRALTFLVISCPCALVISIPLSFFAGIGGASKEGVLIKGSNYLETLADTRYVVFDKTGTLTKGVFEVTGIHQAGMDEKELLRLAAYAESSSTHPISRSLIKAYGEEPDRSLVTDVREISGKGVIATVEGRTVACGNDKLGGAFSLTRTVMRIRAPSYMWPWTAPMRTYSHL